MLSPGEIRPSPPHIHLKEDSTKGCCQEDRGVWEPPPGPRQAVSESLPAQICSQDISSSPRSVEEKPPILHQCELILVPQEGIDRKPLRGGKGVELQVDETEGASGGQEPQPMFILWRSEQWPLEMMKNHQWDFQEA